MSESRPNPKPTPQDDDQRLIRDLTCGDLAACQAAARALQRKGMTVIPVLLRATAERLWVPGLPQPDALSDSQRSEALFALLSTMEGIDSPLGIRSMRMVLADNSEQVRQMAVKLLKRAGRAGFLALEEVLDEGSDEARQEAAWALGELGEPDAIAALSQGLGSANAGVQVACAHALFALAIRNPVPELRLAVRRLEELARYGRTSPLPVRETCRQALHQINAATRHHPSLPIPAASEEPEIAALPIPSPRGEVPGDSSS